MRTVNFSPRSPLPVPLLLTRHPVRECGFRGQHVERAVRLPAVASPRQVNAAVAEGLGDVDAGDVVGAIEVGERARDLEHAVIAARR